jgi:4-amino-4-deoxy-L-arabinose transferase-like glycosyltransferase
MSLSSSRVASSKRALAYLPAILTLLLLTFVCFFRLNHPPLIDLVDEGLYASAARHMVESGDWITPHVSSSVFLEKPPLMFWAEASFIRIFGATPMAARLPSALAAFLTSLALYYWARRKGIPGVGWLAAAVYAVCPLVAIGLARLAMLDSMLTLWLTLAMIGWIEGYGGDRRGYFLMAAAMGLAVMTKGLIGIVLPSVAFLAWLTVRRDWAALRNVPWLAATALFLLIVLPWHLAAWKANGNFFLREYVVHQQVQRFLGQDFGHNKPFWYQVPVLIEGMFPWSAFVPVAWWLAIRRGRRSDKRSLDCSLAMWAVAAAMIFVFFSLSVSKLPNYLLPALPALALLCAARLNALSRERRKLSRLEPAIVGLCGAALGGLSLAVGILGWRWRAAPLDPSAIAKAVGKFFNWKERSESVDILWQKLAPITEFAPLWIALGVVLLTVSILIVASRRDARRIFVCGMLMNLSLIVLIVHVLVPAWAKREIEPVNKLAQLAAPALNQGEVLFLYRLHPPRTSVRYLLGHETQILDTASPEFLQSALTNSGRGYVLTTTDAHLSLSAGTLQPVATESHWQLWRYDQDAPP